MPEVQWAYVPAALAHCSSLSQKMPSLVGRLIPLPFLVDRLSDSAVVLSMRAFLSVLILIVIGWFGFPLHIGLSRPSRIQQLYPVSFVQPGAELRHEGLQSCCSGCLCHLHPASRECRRQERARNRFAWTVLGEFPTWDFGINICNWQVWWLRRYQFSSNTKPTELHPSCCSLVPCDVTMPR